MLNIVKFRICLDIKNGEFICPNPIIVLKSHKDLLQNCEIKDGCIDFSMLKSDLEKLKGVCIPYTIICENCGQCPTKDGEICICDNDTDCDNCSNCIGGVCKPKCPKECVDGTCVDCKPGDCPTNQECLDGKCQCPPNKPYKDSNGVCYGCQDDTQCPPCFRCDGAGNCVPRDCGAGQCDPILDKCVECVNSDACKSQDPNKCCIDKKCECCPGYVLNPTTGKCEPKPECETKKDCGDCEDCVNKKCQPIICPKGYKCDNDDCIEDPCESSPCENGTDCGPECGCLDKICDECAKRSCADCDKAQGCKCNPQTGKCEKVKDCNNNCANELDCANNCGCDEGICKDCSNYSCEECGKIPGCKCVDGKCSGKEKGDCADTFVVEKSKVCQTPELVATLRKDVSCNCEPINFRVTTPSNTNSSFTILAQKSTIGNELVNYSKEGSQYTSDNEYKVTSLFKVKVNGYYVEEVDGVQTQKAFTTGDIVRDFIDFKGEFPLDGVFGLDFENYLRLNTATITITHSSTLFDENKCGYNEKLLFSDSDLSAFTYNEVGKFLSYKPSTKIVEDVKVTSSSKRAPLFVWFEDLNKIVKREYVQGTNTYISVLKPDLYKTKKSYRVTNDCSCQKEAVYLWNCEKENYFETANISYELTDCGKTFKLVNAIQPCNPLHKKETYNIFVNESLFGNLSDSAIIGKKVTYAEGVTSIYIKVDGTECKKDYEIIPQELVELSYTSTCDKDKTKIVISKDTNNVNVKVKSITYGGSDGTLNNLSESNGFYSLTIDSETPINVVYTNGCSELVNLKKLSNCCDGCEPKINGLTEVKQVYLNAGQSGFLQIDNGSCSVVSYTSSSDILTINPDGEIEYVTPNESLDITINVKYSDSCSKQLIVKLVKSPLDLTIQSTSGCKDPVLVIKGSPLAVGLSFKVKSSCGNIDVWEDIFEEEMSLRVPQTANTTCIYSLYEIAGNTINPSKQVTYQKLNTTTLSLDITQVIDNCNDDTKFEISPSSTDLSGFILGYSISSNSSTVNSTAIVFRENNKNYISLSRASLVGDNCTTKSLSVSTLTKDDCVINYNQPIPLSLKCTINTIIKQECVEGKKAFLIEVPSLINALNVKINDEPNTIVANLVHEVKTNTRVFKFVYTREDIAKISFTPIDQNNGLYCQKEFIPTALNCSKKIRTVSSTLLGCVNNGDLTFSEDSGRITIESTDINISNAFTSDPTIFANDSNKKYLITYNNGVVDIPTSAFGTAKVGNDIVVYLSGYPNLNPQSKVRVQVKEDDTYLPYQGIFNVSNKLSQYPAWNGYEVLAKNSSNQDIFKTLQGNVSIQLNDVLPVFVILGPPTALNVTYYNENTPLNTQQNFAYFSGKDTLLANPSTAIPYYLSPPPNATKATVCRTYEDCTTCFDIIFDRPAVGNDSVGIYTNCDGLLADITVFLGTTVYNYVKYNGRCYYLVATQEYVNQDFITIYDLDGYHNNAEDSCGSPYCMNSNNIIAYSPCTDENAAQIFLPVVSNSPEAILYNGICYGKVGENSGASNVDWSDVSSFNDCNSCGVFINLPENSCTNTKSWSHEEGRYLLGSQGLCTEEGQSCIQSGPYFICG